MHSGQPVGQPCPTQALARPTADMLLLLELPAPDGSGPEAMRSCGRALVLAYGQEMLSRADAPVRLVILGPGSSRAHYSCLVEQPGQGWLGQGSAKWGGLPLRRKAKPVRDTPVVK